MDEYQVRALRAFDARNHVAILGAAGTGKSHVLVRIIERARETYGAKHCVACAWTNTAARNINGITVHKLFAAKINWEWTEEGLWDQIRGNDEVREFLMGLKIIIIDEFFSIKSNVLEAIDSVLRRLVRVSWHEGLSLGGRLLVISGDPFQLEPIFPRHERRSTTAVDSSLWYYCFGNDAHGVIVILQENHRQISDREFFQMLSRLRVGKHTNGDLIALNHTSQYTDTPPNTHTRLVLTHREAARINSSILEKLVGEKKKSLALDRFIDVSTEDINQIMDRLDQSAPKEVITKIGARVLLTRKCEDLFPGSELVVVDINTYYLNGGKHPSLSLVCAPFLPIGSHEFDREKRRISIVPMRVPVHSLTGDLLAYREQLPVIPSYAITVHRSQSLSLRRVAIDFRGEVNSRWNPYGKVYVALSRCTNLKGLWVKGLRNDHISVSPSAHRLMRDVNVIRENLPHRVIIKMNKRRSHTTGERVEGSVLNSSNSRSAKRVISFETNNRATKQLRDGKENIST